MTSGKRNALTFERLQALLMYSPETGLFTWRQRMGSRAPEGSVAGSRDVLGYIQLGVDGVNHHAHRLAWFSMTGAMPEFTVDHVNGIVSDNRWENLRDVPHGHNIQNQRRASRANAVGLLGVCASGNRWRATIRAQGRQHHLGCFATPEAAHAAYVEAKRRLHEGCTL